MRKSRKMWRILVGIELGVLALAVVVGFAANNTVPTSAADAMSLSIDINDLAPPECSGITLTNLITTYDSTYTWSGSTVYVYNGTNGNDLIITTDEFDDVISNGGNDCIIAGDGIDYIWSGRGNDVINAGPGADVCFSQGGNDTFINCQTQARVAAESKDEKADVKNPHRRP